MAMRRATISACLLFVVIMLAGCDEVNRKADDAIGSKNPALCKELKQESEVQSCYNKVADGLNDPEVCFQSDDRNGCVSEFALSKRSIKYCDLTTDAVSKYACVASVTGDNTGRAIESIVADWRSKGAVSKCKELCQPDYDSCMKRYWDEYQEELARCAGMPDHSDRSYCEYEAEKTRDRNRLECYDNKDECEEGCMPKED